VQILIEFNSFGIQALPVMTDLDMVSNLIQENQIVILIAATQLPTILHRNKVCIAWIKEEITRKGTIIS
jgi:hypothetical protein